MTSSPSLKELFRAINGYLSTSAVLPLPSNLDNIIDAYLQKCERREEDVSSRVQDELLSIYQKHVHNDPTRYAPFIAVLRQLRPTLRAESRIGQWWEALLEPVLSHFHNDKALASEACGIVLDILTDDEPQTNSLSQTWYHPLADRLIARWIREFEKAKTELAGTGSPQEKLIRQTLIQYGKKKPRDLMLALSSFFVREDSRARILTLLCEFVQNKPPHLHQVLHTPLFDSLLRCLQQDTSTTVINMAMTALIMLLPHMPSSLVPYLPTLFNIYARLLFWDREVRSMIESSPDKVENGSIASSASWEKCSFSADIDDTKIPHLVNYFTILYGLYPINFMDYIRKPQRYLRHANASNADEIEVQPTEIRQKSETLRQCHLLHPNFYSLTIESEKTDFGRWIKSEPPEVLADCMALCLPSEAGRCYHFEGLSRDKAQAPIAENEQDGNKGALLSGSVLRDPSPLDFHREGWRNIQPGGSPAGSRVHSDIFRQSSQSSHPSTRDSLEAKGREIGADSPTLPPHLVLTNPQPQVQDMIISNKVIKTGLHQSLANDSVPSLALSHHESVPEKSETTASITRITAGSPVAASDPSVRISQLYHQILLLNNDLNFERYLKQQHMTHIGELRRRQVRELATEAETQNLLNSNRLLKKGLEDAKKMEKQIKKDSERGRALAKKWEADLAAKLKLLREEQKKWTTERGELKQDLDTVKEDRDKLQKLVSDAELRDRNARQDIKSNEMLVEEMDRLKKEIDRLNISVRDHEAKEAETKAALREAHAADEKVEKLNMIVGSLEMELEQTRRAYEIQIIDLDNRLQEALGQNQMRQTISLQSLVDSAVTASRTKQEELQKQYDALAKRNSVLKTKLIELKSSTNVNRGGYSAESDAETSAIQTRGVSSSSTRLHRGFSDPEAFEGVAYNVTPPLEALFPGDPPPPGEGKMSPQSERYHGRGGVQNALRKERREKKKG